MSYYLGADEYEPKGNKKWLLLALLALGVTFVGIKVARAKTKGPLPKAPDVPPIKNPPPPPVPEAPTHTVVKDDSLSSIAKQYYGDYRWWPVIWDANKKVIGCNWNLILPGQLLSIIDIKGMDSAVVFARPEIKGWKNPPATCGI